MRRTFSLLLICAAPICASAQDVDRIAPAEEEARAAVRAATEAKTRQRALADYVEAITRHVSSHWDRPRSARNGLDCSVRVTQEFDGTVVSMEFGRCNGNARVKKSIEAAIEASSPLPRAPTPAVFERNVTVVFRPDL